MAVTCDHWSRDMRNLNDVTLPRGMPNGNDQLQPVRDVAGPGLSLCRRVHPLRRRGSDRGPGRALRCPPRRPNRPPGRAVMVPRTPANGASNSPSRSRRPVSSIVSSWTGSLMRRIPSRPRPFGLSRRCTTTRGKTPRRWSPPMTSLPGAGGVPSWRLRGTPASPGRRGAWRGARSGAGAGRGRVSRGPETGTGLLADGLRVARLPDRKHACRSGPGTGTGARRAESRSPVNFPPERYRLTGESRAAQSRNTSGAFPLTLQPIRAMLSFVTRSTKSAPNILFQRLPGAAPGGDLGFGDFFVSSSSFWKRAIHWRAGIPIHRSISKEDTYEEGQVVLTLCVADAWCWLRRRWRAR